MQIVRRVVEITGVVQGVSFRWYTLQEAERLALTGWVRNRDDGSVHLEVQGPVGRVEELQRWLHDGPTHARVDAVTVDDVDPVNGEDGFQIRP